MSDYDYIYAHSGGEESNWWVCQCPEGEDLRHIDMDTCPWCSSYQHDQPDTSDDINYLEGEQ